MRQNLFFHFRPRSISPEALRFTLTWGLGGMAALLVVLQLATGMLLSVFYTPLPVVAYESVLHIQNSVFLGRLVRNLHHWMGNGLVVVVFLHLLRVFLTGAFSPPRHRNWLVGLGLGLLILLANFSGYLLPWDQRSYWAITIATSMLSYIPGIGTSIQEIIRGGKEVGAGSLTLFYSIHTTLIPVILFLLMSYHFWFIRKAGGVLIPKKSEKKQLEPSENIPSNELFIREFSFIAIVFCGFLLFSMLRDAPLGNMANPAMTPQNVTAPWYFMGAQELLLHVPPVFAVCILPLVTGVFLISLPFYGNRQNKPDALTKIVLLTGTFLLLSLSTMGIWFRGPAMTMVWPW